VSDVAELKRYVGVHARGQRIKGADAILRRISTDGPGTPGSWVYEWSQVAAGLEQRGRLLDAARHYAMARFPYADGEARQEALDRCVGAVDQWRTGHEIIRLDAELPGGRVSSWATGLSRIQRRPLVLMTGGIVTVKEQLVPVLSAYRAFGLAAVATEMPGAGENTMRYDADSWRMFPGLLDAIAARAEVNDVYLVALSFSGHLALRWAAEDTRVKGIVTVGAPVREFFTSAGWQAAVPGVTRGTLAHLTGVEPDRLFAELKPMALDEGQLTAVRCPVRYLKSDRDEIIPAEEAALLAGQVSDLEVAANDDVHASPGHLLASQLWTLASLLRLAGVSDGRTAALGLALAGLRARGSLRRQPR
jgi:pimeloyl-ACP methyl ester carboxylesterase